MRVGLVIYGSIDTVSGGYLYDRQLVSYLRFCGDDVQIISIPPASYASHLLDNLRFRLPASLDVLIEDELVHPSVLLANYRQPSPAPILSLIHNLHSSERRPAWQNAIFRQLEKAHLASVDGFIFNSAVTRDTVVQLAGDGKPQVLAPPGGDRLGSISLLELQERVQRGGPLRLLFLASVTPLKGLHVLLDALLALAPGACTLDVAGSLSVEPDYARRMQRRAAAFPVPVRFHGLLDGEPIAALLRASDVLVIPSYWEGFGISYLEGMAFGLPAIGTTAGSIPHMIRDGYNGFTIPPGDSASLARILQKLATDRAALARLSANAINYYSSCPTWKDTGEMIRRFLLERLAASGSSDTQQRR